jgi:hypothetical protein
MNSRITIKVFLVITLFFLSSCKEYFITTKVNSDGTVERQVVCKTDEAKKGKLFPETFLTDSLWNIQHRYDSTNKKNIFTANIVFPSYSKAVEELKKQRRNFAPILDIKIEKQFKFFFTYYTYKETYKPYYVFNKTPINKYFSENELNKIKEGADTAWVKNKFNGYEKFSMITAFFDIVGDELYKTDKIKLTDLISEEKKNNLIADLWKAIELKDTGNKDKEKKTGPYADPWVNMAVKEHENNKAEKEVIRKYFNENIALKLDKYIDKCPRFDSMLESMKVYDGSYENSVILPGIITTSNSKSIEGNKLSWKFNQDNFKYLDYEMAAESREINIWVIIASGAVILLLVLGLSLAKLKKKAVF